MKNQKNLRLQIRLHPVGAAGEVQQNPSLLLPVTPPLLPARKISVAYHAALEELLVIRHIAPPAAAARL